MLAKPQGFPRKLGGCAGLDPRLRSAVSAGVGDGERGLRRGLRAPGVGVRPKWVLEYSPSNKRIRYFVSITDVRTGLWTAHKFCGGGEDFCDYLNDYLASTQPANHPLITVFVLPTPSVKQDAFKLFHALGRSTFRLKKPAFAHIYGFDDGNMPEYELPQIPGTPVPFYGLQEVHVITIKPTTSAEEVLTLCRRNCRSEQFVIIHEYQTLADDFIVAASMSAEAGQERTSEGYRIYQTTAS